jgi:hypothetical protein
MWYFGSTTKPRYLIGRLVYPCGPTCLWGIVIEVEERTLVKVGLKFKLHPAVDFP